MIFKPYRNQNYQAIKAQLLRSGQLFDDREFPAAPQSIYRYPNDSFPPRVGMTWKRPKEITHNPKFIVNDIEPKDIHQGSLGNCWFLAAAVSVATHPKYIAVNVPKDQSFDQDYCGIFHFRFWHYGEWVDVVVDDRLPVDYSNNFLFCCNRVNKNELWSCLLEKAYAKLVGCYQFLSGGFTQEALVDMTGGVSEEIDLRDIHQSSEEFWKFLLQANDVGSLAGATIRQENSGLEQKLPFGLVNLHAYSITKIVEIKPGSKHYNLLMETVSDIIGDLLKKRSNNSLNNNSRKTLPRDYSEDSDEYLAYGQPAPVGTFGNFGIDSWNVVNPPYYPNPLDPYDPYNPNPLNLYDPYNPNPNPINPTNDNRRNSQHKPGDSFRLIRLRNPWGNSEWTGPWSDHSNEWTKLDDSIKKELGLVKDNDGEFWMDFNDFIKNYHFLQLVHVNLNALTGENDFQVGETRTSWKCKQYDGEWIPGVNAGGSGVTSSYDSSSFWTNPQYLVNVHSPDKSESDGKATLIVSLIFKQESKIRNQNRGQYGFFPKQFRLYRVNSSRNAVNRSSTTKFQPNELTRVGQSDVNHPLREVCKRFRVEPGSYVIIPCTYEKNLGGKFLLRLYTEEGICENDVTQLVKDSPITGYATFNETFKEDELYDATGRVIESEDFLDLVNDDHFVGNNGDDDDDNASDLSLYFDKYRNIRNKIPLSM